MRLKKLGAALLFVAALSAVLTSSSFAAATTTAEPWIVGGKTLTGSETVTSTAVGAATFTTEVGSTKYKLEATGIECVGCKIENSGSPSSATGSGKLKFTGVTVKEPSGCSVASSIETAALSISADWMSGTTTYVKFVPTAGETTLFATVEITGCALATTLVPKGSVFFEAAHTTGAYETEQELHSSEAINSTAGGSLKVGTKTAVLAGSAKFKLGSGKMFQVGGTGFEPLPNETTMTGFGTMVEEGKEVPIINWEVETPIETKGCKGGKITVVIEAENTETHIVERREASLTEGKSGRFSGKTPVMRPLHGKATIRIVVSGCEHASEEVKPEFGCYIDPSGKVVDGNHEDAPVWEATVTLLSSPTESGTYTAVENGSTVMSPANRVNPDKSRVNGAFGWETIEGYYKVEATKAGCGTASTPAFRVPPPQENLEIVLHCEGEQWKLGEAGGNIAQLAITPPTKACEGKERVENVSFGTATVKVLKETGIECTLKKACEGKTLFKAEKCETELEKSGSKPEYELEVEWNGSKFTKKFPA